MSEQLKSRIFLSCGQSNNKPKGSETLSEYEVVEELRKQLKGTYDLYISVNEQSLSGMTEDIFDNLKKAEYFLFIDFKREKLVRSAYRGSLFTNQELAIAKMLDLDIIPFQERGVKKEDGILKYVHVNCKEFTDRRKLLDDILGQIKSEWHSGWRNELLLERSTIPPVPTQYGTSGRMGRWYHISVKNLHHENIAHQCFAYLEEAIDLDTNQDVTPDQLIEFKWKNVLTRAIDIPPGKSRDLDAFFIMEDDPDFFHLSVNYHIIDNTELLYKRPRNRKYELTYVVFSDSFSPARITLILDANRDMDKIKFYKKGDLSPIESNDRPKTSAFTTAQSYSQSSASTSGSHVQPGTFSPVTTRISDSGP